jgi:hypothetical protein
MSDSAYKQIKIERLYTQLDSVLKRVAEFEDLYKQAIADLQVLAAEVQRWRDEPHDTDDIISIDGSLTKLGQAIKATDKSGALERAK